MHIVNEIKIEHFMHIYFSICLDFNIPTFFFSKKELDLKELNIKQIMFYYRGDNWFTYRGLLLLLLRLLIFFLLFLVLLSLLWFCFLNRGLNLKQSPNYHTD